MNYKNKILYLTTFFSFLFAENNISSIEYKHFNDLKEIEVNSASPKLTKITVDTEDISRDEEIEISDQQLAKNPQLIHYFLNLAIDKNRPELIPDLVAMYKKYQYHDPILIDYALGEYAHYQQDYTEAINIYQKLLEKYPNINKIRYKLAQWQFEDKSFNSAKQNFSQLQQQKLPYFIQKRIAAYQYAIQQDNEFDFEMGVNFLNENNINNASSQPYIYLANRRFNKSPDSLPQKGKGFAYYINLEKSFNIADHQKFLFNNLLSGKYYWNNKKYNDIENRALVGYQYQNAKNRMSISPLFEKRWFDQKQYSHSYGLRFENDIKLANKWQSSFAFEYTKTNYKNKSNPHYKQLYSTTLVYLADSKKYFYIGSDVLLDNTINLQEKSRRYAIRMGWKQDWDYYVSTKIGIQFAKRFFKEKEYLFNKKRFDTEYDLTLNIWKRDFSIFGVVPKIQYKYHKTRSTIPDFYSFKKQQINLLFEKDF